MSEDTAAVQIIKQMLRLRTGYAAELMYVVLADLHRLAQLRAEVERLKGKATGVGQERERFAMKLLAMERDYERQLAALRPVVGAAKGEAIVHRERYGMCGCLLCANVRELADFEQSKKKGRKR